MHWAISKYNFYANTELLEAEKLNKINMFCFTDYTDFSLLV